MWANQYIIPDRHLAVNIAVKPHQHIISHILRWNADNGADGDLRFFLAVAQKRTPPQMVIPHGRIAKAGELHKFLIRKDAVSNILIHLCHSCVPPVSDNLVIFSTT